MTGVKTAVTISLQAAGITTKSPKVHKTKPDKPPRDPMLTGGVSGRNFGHAASLHDYHVPSSLADFAAAEAMLGSLSEEPPQTHEHSVHMS
jgi:hypothetical protein